MRCRIPRLQPAKLSDVVRPGVRRRRSRRRVVVHRHGKVNFQRLVGLFFVCWLRIREECLLILDHLLLFVHDDLADALARDTLLRRRERALRSRPLVHAALK